MLRRHKKAAIAALIAVLTLGGTAFAYWTQGGSGTGGATTGTTTAITVNQTSINTGLFPGSTASPLSGTFTNPGEGSVHISSLTAVVAPFSSGSAGPLCTEADFGIGGTSGPYDVLPGATTTWSGLAISMLNTAFNQDNCKGVSPAISYTATP